MRGVRQAVLISSLMALGAGAGLAQSGDRPFRGATVRQVWADRRTDLLGAPSLDGRYLAFVDWETGDLAVRDLATGQNYRLTNKGSWRDSAEYAYFSVISPDSRQVAYAWFNEQKFYELRVVSIEDTRPPLLFPTSEVGAGGPPGPLLSRPGVALPRNPGVRGSTPRVLCRGDEVQFIKPTFWSMDGKYILALVFGKKILNQIVLFSTADGSMKTLKTPFWIYPKMMGMSPDGRWIVYSLNQEPPYIQHDIFLLSTDGTQDIPLVEHPANDVFPVWAPDGKSILFTSNRSGTLDVWGIPMADAKAQGPPVMVKKDIGRFLPLGFTRKGSFYYGLRTGTEDAYVASLDPATGKVLEPPKPVSKLLVNVNRSPDWSPDGRQLAFLSRVDTENHGVEMRVVTIQSAETGEERQFGVPKLGYLDWLRWSPDGRSFLVGGSDTNNNFGGLYQVDAESGQVTALVQGAFAPPRGFQGVWSRDGKAVFYLHEDMRQTYTSMRFRNLENGQEQILHQTAPHWRHNNLALSPDGRFLAFGLSDGNRTQAKVLLVIPAPGGEAREVLKLNHESLSGVAWTRDGSHLLFSRAGKGKPELCRIPARGGEPRSLGLAANENARVSFHPDGRRIAYTAGETSTEVWVMEDFLPASRASR